MTSGTLSTRSPSEQHAPGTAGSAQPHSRRTLLRGAADLGAVLALGVPVAIAGDLDPFPELERRFWHFSRWEGLPKGMEEDDPRIALYSQGWQASAAAIIATPATSMSGIGTKVRVLMLELTDGESDYGEDLARSLLVDVERLTGEATHA
jgi:hypothetical protein